MDFSLFLQNTKFDECNRKNKNGYTGNKNSKKGKRKKVKKGRMWKQKFVE